LKKRSLYFLLFFFSLLSERRRRDAMNFAKLKMRKIVFLKKKNLISWIVFINFDLFIFVLFLGITTYKSPTYSISMNSPQCATRFLIRPSLKERDNGWHCRYVRGDHFRFGSVFIFKKQPNRKAKKKKGPKPNRNQSKPTGFGSVWVRFFRSKTGKTYGYFSSFVMGF